MNDAQVVQQGRGMMRWVVLLAMSLVVFSNYYLYDCFSTLKGIVQVDLAATSTDWALIRNFYNVPNTFLFMALLGGIFLDRFGIRKTGFVFTLLCALGGIITAYGVSDVFRGGGFGYEFMASFLPGYSPELKMMMFGRLLFGLGAETQIVMLNKVLAKWFKGKELAFAFGVSLTIARLGSYMADLSPTWADFAYAGGWQPPLVVAAVIGSLCLICAILYGVLEVLAKRRYTLGEAGASDKLVIRDLFTFSRSFWYITLLCVVFYSAIFPFRSFSIKYFIEGWDLARNVAGQFNSVLPLAAMIATPIFGLMCDKLGKRALFMVFGSIILMPVYLMMAYQVVPLTVPVIMMGIAFSLIPAIMWPAVAYIVEERRLGTAYAVMFLIQQLGVAGMNWLIGRTNDAYGANAANPDGYIPMMLAFSVLGVLGLIFAVLLRREEMGPRGHGLETIKA